MARTHGHRTDSACCRWTPCLHRLRTASVRLRTISVRIGTVSTTEIPLSKRSQYGLKRYTNGLKWYANGASTASVYSRLSPSYARVYGPFSLWIHYLIFPEGSNWLVVISRCYSSYNSRCNGKYTFVVLAINDKPHRIHPQSQHKRYGYLTGITGNNVENATQSSQGVKLIIEKGAKIFCEGTGECIQIQQSITTKADILRENLFHTEDRLYLALEDIHMLVDLEIGLHESCNIPVCVEFENKLIQFESLHQSIEKLPPLQAQRIFPDECHFPKPTCTITGPLLADSCRLSDDQELALRAMLSAPSHGPPFLLSGPFGTGKTYILAAAAHCFFKQGREDHSFVRIFVGTQQHVAAQKFLECFVDIMLPHDDIDIARVVPDSYHMKSSDMKEYTWTASDFRSSLASFKRQHLCLVIATCMTSMQLGRLLPGSFTHLLLDEGANLREPEGIIPLQLADPNTKIVIAGDHHQVS